MRDLPSILSLFCNEFNNSIIQSMNVRFYLSYDIITILKSHFLRENVRVLQYA